MEKARKLKTQMKSMRWATIKKRKEIKKYKNEKYNIKKRVKKACKWNKTKMKSIKIKKQT